MSVDIDFYTLHRLTDKAFKFDENDRREYKKKILECIDNKEKDGVDLILDFISDEYTSRRMFFAAGTADPKSILKPKGRIFRRVSGENKENNVQSLEITNDEINRRLAKAVESSEKNKLFYESLEINTEIDSSNENWDDTVSDGELENILKEQIKKSEEFAEEEQFEEKHKNDKE